MARSRTRRRFAVALTLMALVAAGSALALREGWVPFARVRWARPANIDVLDTGAEPRRVLRYSWNAAARPFTLLMQRGMGRIRGVFQTQEDYGPPLALHLEPEESVTRLGVVRVTWRIGAADIGDDDKVPSHASRATSEAGRQLVGRRIRAYLGPSGEIALELGSGAEGLEARLLEDLQRALELELAPPLPKEAVGVGARWRTTHRRKLALVDQADCTATFQLDGVEADSIDLNATFAFAAEPVPVPLEGQGETPVVLDRLEGQLAGRIVRLLGEPTPVFSDLSLEADASLSPVPRGQATPTDEQRQKGYRLVVTSRDLMQADAVGTLSWEAPNE